MKIKYNTAQLISAAILSFGLSLGSSAQITFQQHYFTPYDQSGKEVLQTGDGGYLIAATTENNTLNDLDILILKTDAYGNVTTTKTFNKSMLDYPNSMLPSDDGNYFVLGAANSAGGDQNMYLMKVKDNCDTIFTKMYGGFGNEEAKEMVRTPDGNYAIIGASNSSPSTNNDMRLYKIDPSGNVLWMKTYGTSQYESARSIKVTPDGGFIIAGKTAVDPLSMASLYLVKTDVNGDTMWTKTISGGASSFEGKSIIANSDGTYILALDDSTASHDSDVRIMKLDNSGGIVWNKSYGGTDKDICKTIRPTSDGGYIVSSVARSFGWVNPDMWILKLDANGDTVWTQHFGGSGHEHCYSVRQTSDGGYIAVGHARSFSASWEVYLVKMDASGVVGIEEFAADNKLSLYPNPSDGSLNVDLSGMQDFTSFRIANSLGQTVYSEDLKALRGNQLMTVDLKNNAPGVYFVTIESSNKTITKKLILN